MIETTTKTVDGLNFISDFRIVEPRERRNGVYIERIYEPLLRELPTFQALIKKMGLRKIDTDFCTRESIYAISPFGYFQYKCIRFLLKGYWNTMRWLYDNARLFKQIPPTESFSWRYFTPYTWIHSLWRKFRK